MDDYAPIEDHGLIGDLQTAALVTKDGTVDWFCCPRFDSPSVFGALLDRTRGGAFQIRPATSSYTTNQLYLPDTAVLITRFMTEAGVGEIVDFMPPNESRTPTDRHQMVRMTRCVRGEMEFVFDVSPRFDYGRLSHDVHVTEHGAVFRADGLSLTLHPVLNDTDQRLALIQRDESGGLHGSVRLTAGQVRGVVLESAADGPPRRIPVTEAEGDLRGHGPVLAWLAVAVDVHRSLAGDAATLRHHAQAHDVRTDRRPGGGADRRPA